MSSTSLSGSNINRAERNISILNLVKSKYAFTDEEQKVWENQMKFSQAEVELEKGKYHLKEGNYAESLEHIRTANKYYRKPKLTLLSWFLKISPFTALKLFKKLRPSEFSFITSNQAIKRKDTPEK